MKTQYQHREAETNLLGPLAIATSVQGTAMGTHEKIFNLSRLPGSTGIDLIIMRVMTSTEYKERL